MKFGDNITFTKIFQLNYIDPPEPGITSYDLMPCKNPVRATFKGKVAITHGTESVEAAAVNYGGQEVYVPFDSIQLVGESNG